MAQQTAVNWIEDNLKNVKEGYQYMVLGGEEYVNIKHLKGIIEQAKRMEIAQIMDSYMMGSYDKARKKFNPQKYYDETYGSNL